MIIKFICGILAVIDVVIALAVIIARSDEVELDLKVELALLFGANAFTAIYLFLTS